MTIELTKRKNYFFKSAHSSQEGAEKSSVCLAKSTMAVIAFF